VPNARAPEAVARGLLSKPSRQRARPRLAQGLDRADRKILGDDISLVEFGWPLGMPLCRALGLGLWEVRSDVTDGKIARVIFCVAKERMVLLHGFIKKSQKTPKSALDLARKRKKELE
jgi:phage-related protein